MYSYEIERLLKIRNYIISTSEYFEIISTSPQITNIKYEGYSDTFTIKTDDNYSITFKVLTKSVKV